MYKYLFIFRMAKEYTRFNVFKKYANTIEEGISFVRDVIDTMDFGSNYYLGTQVNDLAMNECIGFITYNGKFFNVEEAKKLGFTIK